MEQYIDLQATQIFLWVARLGSFTRAAQVLKLPKSTVSRAISRLEVESGTKLILRTTRQLTLTAAGRLYYERCQEPFQTIEEARRSLNGQDSIMSGLVRITCPEDLGLHAVAPALAQLAQRHPSLFFEVIHSDDRLDLVQMGIDLAVRIGKLENSSLKASRVGIITMGLIASPDYLRQHPPPRTPEDLTHHRLLSFVNRGPSFLWNLRKGRKSISLPAKAGISVNQMSTLVSLARSGAGIALVPHYLCKTEFQSKSLCQVLPAWEGNEFPVSLVTTVTSDESARLKLVKDAVKRSIESTIKWKG